MLTRGGEISGSFILPLINALVLIAAGVSMTSVRPSFAWCIPVTLAQSLTAVQVVQEPPSDTDGPLDRACASR